MSKTWAMIALTIAPLWSQTAVVKADDWKSDADVLAQQLREAAQRAEKWIVNAELQAEQLAGLKNRDWDIELQMQSSLARIRTADFAARSQILARIEKTYFAALQTHAQVDQAWQNLLEVGQALSVVLKTAPPDCVERTRFEAVYKRRKEQGAEMKAYQKSSESRLLAIVDEARWIHTR